MKSFKDVPLTIGELRTQKTPDCKLWSPRDLLVSLLRDIDSGNVTVTDLVVCYARDENHGRYIRAGDNPTHHVSMIEVAKTRMIGDMLDVTAE